MHASRDGNSNIIQGLLRGGAHPNIGTDNGATPLMATTAFGTIQDVRILIAFGAELDSQDSFGQTALIDSTVYKRNEMVRVLLEYGANANIKDIDGKTALMHAHDANASTNFCSMATPRGSEILNLLQIADLESKKSHISAWFGLRERSLNDDH
jgi:FOG: Ankyrin repeat